MTGARASQASQLSDLGRKFVLIDLGDYPACEKFIKNNKGILTEPERHFLDEAVEDICACRLGSARRCIQQALILRYCVEYTKNGRDRSAVFDKLIEQDDAFVRKFNSESERIFSFLSEKAKSNRQQSSASSQGASTTQATPIPGSIAHAPRHADTLTSPIPQPYNIAPVGSLPYAVRHGNQTGLPSISETPGLGRGNTHAPVHSLANQSWQRSEAPGLSRHGSSGGATGKKIDKLSAHYTVRPSTFFVVGRVFSVHWPENAGMVSSTASGGGRTETRGSGGQRIFSEFRRMVVVRGRHGFCLAVPVNTYNKRGVSKSGLNQQDIDAHAIIHMTGTQPVELEGEPTMVKKPIEVIPVGPDQKLDPASRINFGKIHTIE